MCPGSRFGPSEEVTSWEICSSRAQGHPTLFSPRVRTRYGSARPRHGGDNILQGSKENTIRTVLGYCEGMGEADEQRGDCSRRVRQFRRRGRKGTISNEK